MVQTALSFGLLLVIFVILFFFITVITLTVVLGIPLRHGVREGLIATLSIITGGRMREIAYDTLKKIAPPRNIK